MYPDKIVELFKILKIGPGKQTGMWMMSRCPFAKWLHTDSVDKHPSFGVSIGDSSKYNCFGCGRSGNLLLLPTALEYISGKKNEAVREHIGKNEMASEPKVKGSNNCLLPIPDWALKRFSKLKGASGIYTKETILAWDIRFDSYEYRMIFPVYTPSNEVVGIRGRFLGDSDAVAKYRTYGELNQSGDAKRSGLWYGMQFPVVKNKWMFLVEGERDALLLRQVGASNVWGSMGAVLTDTQINTVKKLKNPICLFFDNDNEGHRAAKKVKDELKDTHTIYEVKDYCGMKDPAEAVEKRKIRSILKSILKFVGPTKEVMR